MIMEEEMQEVTKRKNIEDEMNMVDKKETRKLERDKYTINIREMKGGG